MTRLVTGAGTVRRAMPDIYTVLLMVGILFLLIGTVVVAWDLLSPSGYAMGIGQLFTGAEIPPKL